MQQQLVFQQKVNQNLQSQITTNGNLSEYVKRLEYSVNNFEKKYSEQVQINAELTTLLKNININNEKERDKSRNNKKSIKSMKYK